MAIHTTLSIYKKKKKKIKKWIGVIYRKSWICDHLLLSPSHHLGIAFASREDTCVLQSWEFYLEEKIKRLVPTSSQIEMCKDERLTRISSTCRLTASINTQIKRGPSISWDSLKDPMMDRNGNRLHNREGSVTCWCAVGDRLRETQLPPWSP